jgi:hypothetical protein
MGLEINIRSIIPVSILMLSLALLSCGKEKQAEKEKLSPPPGHAKAIESYKKSVEESKKVVVAKVNGVEITTHDLINEMNVVAPQYIKPGQKKDPQVDEKVKKEALDRLVYRELAVQEAVRQGMKVAPEKIGDSLKRIKADLKSEDAFRQKLMISGITEEGLKKQIERDLLVGMITEKEIFGKIAIDQKQVEKTYAKKKDSYKGVSGNPMSLEEARPLIEQELMAPAVAKREYEWVEGLKKSARIEITLGQSADKIHSVE